MQNTIAVAEKVFAALVIAAVKDSAIAYFA
jgi:hypothetical protein